MQKENTMTVGQWCGQWFIANRPKWNGNTEGGYRNLIYGHIIPSIGSVALSDLTKQQTITDFYDSLRSQGLGQSGTGPAHSLQPSTALPGAQGRGIQNSPFAPGATPALLERGGEARRAPSHLHRTIKRPAAM